ncbi:MAG: cation:proton antiporter [Acidithiobacillales bacterium SM23_46]|jgi:multicomponent Na+:H+ antiporter subunit D|nr:MAG: cation:proton antiporter [Acidithiobacillales bacterium SM23_46]
MSPAVIMIAGALLAPLLPGRARGPWLIALPLVALAVIWAVPLGAMSSIEFLDYTLTPWQMNSIGRLFATVFAIMAAAGTLYGLHQARPIELVAAQIYAGSAIGVCFSGDLITLFAYWEIMALASTVVIWSNGSERAYRASLRYVVMHLFGGVLLMAGIAGHVTSTGSVAFGPLALDRAAHWLILAGVLLNAGAPPLSAWIPDAYPEASPSGSVFLSAFTTKTAVFVLWVAFAGAPILVWVGLYMIFYGIIYALLENDMRRILAYSIVNQVGFMVAGIGIGTTMALNGAAAHAFAHIIYKALLLMSAGAVLYMTGKRKCTDLGGLFQSMPLTTVCGIVGALAISAFPLTSGFVSKSMISQAAADETLLWVWLLLAAASAGVFLHAGIKFPWFVFFQKDSGLRPPDPPRNMRVAMVLFAVLCIALGVYPAPLYAILPFPVDYIPYTAAHVITQLQLLLFAGLAFFALLPLMRRTNTITLDTDWLYRCLTPAAWHQLERLWLALRRIRDTRIQPWWQESLLRQQLHAMLTSRFSARATIGNFVLLTTLVLLSYLVLYLLF